MASTRPVRGGGAVEPRLGMRPVERDQRRVAGDPQPVAVRRRVVRPAVDGEVVAAGAGQLVGERRERLPAAAQPRQHAVAGQRADDAEHLRVERGEAVSRKVSRARGSRFQISSRRVAHSRRGWSSAACSGSCAAFPRPSPCRRLGADELQFLAAASAARLAASPAVPDVLQRPARGEGVDLHGHEVAQAGGEQRLVHAGPGGGRRPALLVRLAPSARGRRRRRLVLRRLLAELETARTARPSSRSTQKRAKRFGRLVGERRPRHPRG